MKTWNDITVAQWQHIQNVLETEENELLRWVQILPVLMPITQEQIRAMKTSKFGKLIAPWKALFEQPNTNSLASTWTHGDKEFVCDVDLRNITGGQFIDASELNKSGDVMQNYHTFLALWWHEKEKGYDAKYLVDRAEYIKQHMPMSIAFPTANHFFLLWVESLPAIQTYLRAKGEQVAGLASNGTGIAS